MKQNKQNKTNKIRTKKNKNNSQYYLPNVKKDKNKTYANQSGKKDTIQFQNLARKSFTKIERSSAEYL